jgi:hypothetical protein
MSVYQECNKCGRWKFSVEPIASMNNGDFQLCFKCRVDLGMLHPIDLHTIKITEHRRSGKKKNRII